MDVQKEISLRNAISYCIENNDANTATNRIMEFIRDEKEAINFIQCCTELKSEIDPNFKFRNEDFKYSEFIKGVGKEYNYVLGNKHYFVNGELVKIL